MFICADSECIRYSGRWHISPKQAVTTAPGSMIEMSFRGRDAVLHFDISTNEHPYPHLWVTVDGGAKIEVPIDRYLRVEAVNEGNHHVTVIFKGAVERQHRWHFPLIGKVSFCGFEANSEGSLPLDDRKTIEFIGDSITEGVLVDAQYDPGNLDQPNRVYQDDVTATYAYLTAAALGLKPIFMAYGAVGTTCSGQGSVPRAAEAYPFCFHYTPMKSDEADYVVINLGTNDRAAGVEAFLIGLTELLKLVRNRNQKAKIAVMIPFLGCFGAELREFVARYNQQFNEDLLLVDTSGWLPISPLHPLREGHKVAAEKLVDVLRPWL